MKKILCCFAILLVALSCVGCKDRKVEIKDCLSEVTRVYYEAENENLSVSICVGEREEKYVIDGKHGSTCSFSLIALKFNNQQNFNNVEAQLKVNGEDIGVTLELNPANHFYMADIGYGLGENDEIILTCGENTLNLENASKNFNIDYQKAMEIALENFGDDLNDFYQDGNFKGECYLKVLTLSNYGEDELFWIFTAVGQNKKTKNIIININDGSVIVKN